MRWGSGGLRKLVSLLRFSFRQFCWNRAGLLQFLTRGEFEMLVANLLPLMACSFIAAEMMDIAPAFDFLTLALAVQAAAGSTGARSMSRL